MIADPMQVGTPQVLAPLPVPHVPGTAPIVPPADAPPIAGLSPITIGAPATSAGPGAPSLQGRISAIAIHGNVNITVDAIKAVLAEKVGDDYSAAQANKDRDAIKGMGYFNGDVGVSATLDAAGGVDVSFTVIENPFIKKILFSANTPNGQPTIPAVTLLSKMQTRENQVLNINTLTRDLDNLFNAQTGYVRSQGFVFDINTDLINIDSTTGTLYLPLIEAHIQSITVTGNKKTKTVVVMRELKSKPGDVLDEKKLQKDLTKVYNLGLFDEVGPFEEVPTDVGEVAISIPVVEKRSGQFSVGVGYSSRSKLVGRAELAENNFRGLGERLSLSWEVGGVNSSSSLELGFTEPYLDKHHTALSVDLYDKAIYRFTSDSLGASLSSSSTYTEKRRGGIVDLSRPVSDTASVGLSVRDETVRTNDDLVNLQDSYFRQNGNVGAVGAHFTSDTKDNEISPAEGGIASVSYEVGSADTTTVDNAPSPLVPGRHNFTKFGVDLRRYISLQGPRKVGSITQPKNVFAIRLLMGVTNSDIPFFEQYFLGGADSLRGYDTDEFWGNKLALVQSEFRIPVGKGDSFQAVLLADAGDAWGSIYQGQTLPQHKNFQLSSDYGVGIRLTTPLGPIRLDYAIGKRGGRTQFSIGQSF